MPRLTHLAGLELSTDLNLNIVAPEDAARLLREASPPARLGSQPMPPEDTPRPPLRSRAAAGRAARTAAGSSACARSSWPRRWRSTAPPEDIGEPEGIAWYPDRTWHGRTYVPATAPTSGRL